MIVLFHALFLVTKYFFNVISTIFQPFSRGCEPVENETQISKIKYEGSNVTSEAVFDEFGNPTFFPPVYVQRYLAVRSVLEDERWNGKVRKLVDFGCAEFGLFPYLKHVPGLQEILTIDLDKDLLEQYKCRVAPLNSDYLKCREEPLEVQVLAGSISDTDECLLGCDAVICVELIEHLYPDTLEDVPYTVFGFIKPVVAVFTTPNSEFNVIFPNNKGFRHWDHKFEWTREQFYCWASNIIVRYPDYAVNFQDIGPGPPGTEAVGACSQMAVFIKKMKCNIQETSESTKSIQKESALQKYTLVRQYVYPHRVDTRTEEMKIRDQAEYSIRMLSTCDEFKKDDRVEIPLAAVLPTVEKWTKSVQTLRKLLEEAGWNMVEQEPNCLAVVYSWSRSSSESSLRSDSCEAYEWYKGIPENSTYDVVEENWDTDLTDEKTSFSSWQTMNVFSVPNPDGCVNNKLVKPGENEEASRTHGVPKPLVDSSHAHNSSQLSKTSEILSQIDEASNDQISTACGFNSSTQTGSNVHEHKINSSDEFWEQSKRENSIQTSMTVPDKLDSASVNVTVGSSSHSCDVLTMRTTQTNSDLNKKCTPRDLLSRCGVVHNMKVGIVQHVDSKKTQTASCDSELQSFQDPEIDIPYLFPEVTDSIKRYNSTDKEDSPTRLLCLNLQSEVTQDNTVTIAPRRVELDRLTDSPMIDSCSLDEPNDKLADSGYPNSASAQDMDMDLTPEQVDEILTENDVLSNHSNGEDNSDSLSVSSGEGDSDSIDDDDMHFRPIYIPRNEMLFEAMNVENGDVANNNRDGEGNNAIAVLPHPQPRNLVDDLLPLLEAAEDLDNDNEVHFPENVEPFPHWLLNLLGLANHGGGDAGNFGPVLVIPEDESEDDEDLDVNIPVPPVVADEGLGDEFNSGSSNTDTAASEHGSDEGLNSDGDIDALVLDPIQEVAIPGDMGGGGEPNIFRDGVVG